MRDHPGIWVKHILGFKEAFQLNNRGNRRQLTPAMVVLGLRSAAIRHPDASFGDSRCRLHKLLRWWIYTPATMNSHRNEAMVDSYQKKLNQLSWIFMDLDGSSWIHIHHCDIIKRPQWTCRLTSQLVAAGGSSPRLPNCYCEILGFATLTVNPPSVSQHDCDKSCVHVQPWAMQGGQKSNNILQQQ